MNQSNPLISVIMSVYNGEKYLREAVDSILKQTYKNFEFLIINDGSSDKSVEIINSYNDKRIILVNNNKNLGLPASLNKLIELSKGKYIARMDCDDICMPKRLEKQITFMENNPDVGLCFTNGKVFGVPELKLTASYMRHFEILLKDSININNMTSEQIKALFLFINPFCHPTAMFRKEIIDKHSLKYSENILKSQDLELWIRCSDKFPIHYMNEKLIYYRRHFAQAGRASSKEQLNFAVEIRKNWLENNGFSFKDKEYVLMVNPFSLFDKNNGCNFFNDYNDMLKNLSAQNKELKYFNEEALDKVIGKIYYGLCLKATRQGYFSFKELKKVQFHQTGSYTAFLLHSFMGKMQRIMQSCGKRSGKK